MNAIEEFKKKIFGHMFEGNFVVGFYPSRVIHGMYLGHATTELARHKFIVADSTPLAKIWCLKNNVNIEEGQRCDHSGNRQPVLILSEEPTS